MSKTRLNLLGVLAVFTVVGLIVSMVYIDFRLKSAILEIAKSKAQVSQTQIINEIVNEEIVSQIEYQDIVMVHKDDQGRIVMIQPNAIILNKIMANTVREVSASLKDMEEQELQIPLGEVTGSKILAGYGPRMNVRVITAGQVHVSILNRFDQAGINQTRHLIYFNIDNTIKLAVPFLNEEIKVSTVIPLAETIIVGSVPDTYVSLTGENDDLVAPILQRNRMEER